jgi:hypothetical protein
MQQKQPPPSTSGIITSVSSRLKVVLRSSSDIASCPLDAVVTVGVWCRWLAGGERKRRGCQRKLGARATKNARKNE